MWNEDKKNIQISKQTWRCSVHQSCFDFVQYVFVLRRVWTACWSRWSRISMLFWARVMLLEHVYLFPHALLIANPPGALIRLSPQPLGTHGLRAATQHTAQTFSHKRLADKWTHISTSYGTTVKYTSSIGGGGVKHVAWGLLWQSLSGEEKPLVC